MNYDKPPRREDTDVGMAPDRLVSDEDLNDLVEAEYLAAGAPVDELAKSRVWHRLERQIAATKPKPWRRLPSIAAMVAVAASMAGIVVATKVLLPPQPYDGVKGSISVSDGLELEIFELHADGSAPSELTSDVLDRDVTVVFKVRTSPSSPEGSRLVAVAIEATGEPPFLAVDPRPFIASDERWIESSGELLGFKLSSANTPASVCLKIASEPRAIPTAKPSHCRTIRMAATKAPTP